MQCATVDASSAAVADSARLWLLWLTSMLQRLGPRALAELLAAKLLFQIGNFRFLVCNAADEVQPLIGSTTVHGSVHRS